MASVTTIHICTTCRDPLDEAAGIETRAGARLHAAVVALAAQRGGDVEIVGVECLSVCKRPCTVGFAAPGKWTYVYGDFSTETAETILAGAALYAQAPDGLIPWKQRPDALKKGVVSRMPPFPRPSLETDVPEAAE
jgi:predicted metal-binding protein